MSTGRGGARVGAGRKKKPLAEKIENNIYNKPITVLKVEDRIIGEDMPQPSELLSQQTKGASENIAKEVYEKTWLWLKSKGCERLIIPQAIEQYAMSIARWRQAESAVHTFGFLAKHPTTEMPIASPFVKITQDYMKQANALWLQIYQVIKENCTESLSTEESDPMAILLNEGLKGGKN